jgi:hypothetical protein
MLSKTREGSRGGLLGTTCLTDAEGRAAPGSIARLNRWEAIDDAAAMGMTGFL